MVDGVLLRFGVVAFGGEGVVENLVETYGGELVAYEVAEVIVDVGG